MSPSPGLSFARSIYEDTKRLFSEGEVEAFLFRQDGQEVCLPKVRLIHQGSGLEVTCDEFPTQTENYIAAALRLRAACDRAGH